MRRVVSILALALATPAAAAQEPADSGPYRTLEAVARRVLEVHPGAEAARAAVEAADAGIRVARAAWWPDLALQASGVRFEEPMVVAPIHGFDPQSLPDFDTTLLQGGAGLSWTAFDGGRRGARIDQARSRAGAADARRRDVEAELVEGAVSSFVALSAALDATAVQLGYIEALDAETERAGRQVEAGASPELVLLRARAERARAEADRQVAVARVELLRTALARLLDVSPDRFAPPAAFLPPDEAASEAPVEASPRVREAMAEAGAAEAEWAAARGAWLPEVAVTGGYSVFAGGDTDAVGEWQAGLRLSYPLFTGGARSGGIEAAEASRRAARAGVEAARDAVARAVDDARLAEAEARARLEALLAAESAFEEVVRVERLALAEGAGVQADLLAAEADLRDVRLGIADARRAALLARIRRARATGILTPEWLQTLSPEGS